MGRLDDKVAIVTGGAGGIGLATARRFVEEGARVLLVDLEAKALDEAASGLDPDRVAVFAGDISSAEDTERYVRAAVDRFGGLDVLFANAGIEGRVAPLLDSRVEDLDRVLAVNVRGVWLGIRHAAPEIAKRGGGSIVVTSSVAGFVGVAGLAPYVASKHAVIGLVKSTAQELAPLGIRVNTVNPGPVENRMMRSIEQQSAPDAPESIHEGFVGQVPMGRYATNEEVAAMALFLASDESSYSTGASFLVDGGMVSR